MVQECKFDKVRDIMECRPGLATDISKAKETGMILDVGLCDEYNGFGDPSQVGSIVRDVFTQIDNLRFMAKKAGVAPATMPGVGSVDVQTQETE